jgi:hypothetical protein
MCSLVCTWVSGGEVAEMLCSDGDAANEARHVAAGAGEPTWCEGDSSVPRRARGRRRPAVTCCRRLVSERLSQHRDGATGSGKACVPVKRWLQPQQRCTGRWDDLRACTQAAGAVAASGAKDGAQHRWESRRPTHTGECDSVQPAMGDFSP